MSAPEDEGRPGSGGEDVADGPVERVGYRKDLSDLVDDLEERVAEEHRSEAAPAAAAERADTIPDDAGDEAPD
ncbi:hypothetical protein ACFTWF_22510 [Rhodococcus sp. NPDC056960]|uniref:hypothetical protein n=1 Tax=Rhodococcus sp. NPDC056960 TaxID=3345982 RepID=UPI003629C096